MSAICDYWLMCFLILGKKSEAGRERCVMGSVVAVAHNWTKLRCNEKHPPTDYRNAGWLTEKKLTTEYSTMGSHDVSNFFAISRICFEKFCNATHTSKKCTNAGVMFALSFRQVYVKLPSIRIQLSIDVICRRTCLLSSKTSYLRHSQIIRLRAILWV